jgi:tetratricopeptide (TPR) repeat protein
MYKTLLLLALVLLTSCNTVKSSLAYTKGTQYLEQGDYTNAIQHLEEAVKLDPDLARNHSNLAAAYGSVGEDQRAWQEIRLAVLSPYRDIAALPNFCACYNALIKNRLDQPGTDALEVMHLLGEPDLKIMGESQMIWVYGLCHMHFENNKLVKCQLKL